ncbi:MAG: response regulator transcription factor [Candidatus Eremiobacteraeota bacterium]|nr:response regulator transcription factor [Candidatus Eremiobacteraeota bacterium]
MIRVMVVDDHPIVRKGLGAVLEDQADFELVGVAGSAEDLLANVIELHPDVVLLDLKLSGMSGVEATARLARVDPQARVVVFTAFDSDDNIAGAMRNGAKGFLLKGAPASEIAQAIRSVHAGGSYVQSQVADKIVRGMRRVPGGGLLTPRQREVLGLIGAGLSNKQIAQRLRIAERTAKFHVRSIMDKLGADNRAQAVALAAGRDL